MNIFEHFESSIEFGFNPRDEFTVVQSVFDLREMLANFDDSLSRSTRQSVNAAKPAPLQKAHVDSSTAE